MIAVCLKFIANIRNAGLRARDLVKRILAFGRPVDTDIGIICVVTVIDEALVILKAVIPSNIRIQTEFAGELNIRADSSQMHQLIVGLCTNAVQAMPELSGDDLISAIRELRADQPVIMCSGHSAMIDRDRVRELGINTILMKPVSRSILARAIRDVLPGTGEIGNLQIA